MKRLLSAEDVVIADGLNYIKGFRYQLFCEAKALQTPSCVVIHPPPPSLPSPHGVHVKLTRPEVHVAAPVDVCRGNNSSTSSSSAGNGDNDTKDGPNYPEDVFDNLVFRFEEPNGMARWDSPLFTVPHVDATPDLLGIWDAVARGAKVVPNHATVLKPPAENDYLYELDKTTQEIVAVVLEHQRSAGDGGGSLPVAECEVVLELPARTVTVAQLQRVRRQFVSLNRQHSVGKRRIRELFVEYVNREFR